MKKFILTLISIVALAVVPVLAATGVWTAVGSSSSGGGNSCYLITDASGYIYIGTGVVNSSKFTGFLRTTSNPVRTGFAYNTSSSYGSFGVSVPYSRVYGCGSSSACAAANAYGNYHSTYNNCTDPASFYSSYSYNYGTICAPATVQVSAMPINSAQPTACW